MGNKGAVVDEPSEATHGTVTAAEITQQPQAWREAAEIIDARRAEIDAFLAPLTAKAGLRIVFTGAGTSAFAGGVVAPTVARSTGLRAEHIATTDIVSNPRHCFAEDVPTLLVSFARSGDSPESLAATRLASEMVSDVRHLVITCNEEGELGRVHSRDPRSFVLTMPPRTNDQGFAMTSSFTTMVLSALLVFIPALRSHVELFSDVAEDLVSRRWQEVAGLAAPGTERLVFLGSGPLRALAQEGALKTLELTAGGIAAFYDSSLGFRHGPKAVLNEKTLVVLFESNDEYTEEYDRDIFTEVASAVSAQRVILVGAGAARAEKGVALPRIGGIDDGGAAIVYAIVAQILALTFSVQRGVTSDNPFPNGSVNRVVQGVSIHALVPRSDAD